MRAPLKNIRVKLERMLNLFANAATGKDLNHASPKQLQNLFLVLNKVKIIYLVQFKKL